jgi:hypothetical protein
MNIKTIHDEITLPMFDVIWGCKKIASVLIHVESLYARDQFSLEVHEEGHLIFLKSCVSDISVKHLRASYFITNHRTSYLLADKGGNCVKEYLKYFEFFYPFLNVETNRKHEIYSNFMSISSIFQNFLAVSYMKNHGESLFLFSQTI